MNIFPHYMNLCLYTLLDTWLITSIFAGIRHFRHKKSGTVDPYAPSLNVAIAVLMVAAAVMIVVYEVGTARPH